MSVPVTKPAATEPDVPVVSGGPLDPNDPAYNPDLAPDPNLPAGTPPVTPPAATPAAAPAAAASGKIVYRGMNFNSEAELDAYILALQSGQKPAPAAAPAGPVLIDGKPLEEVMFNDPIRYHQYVVEEARRLAREDIHAIDQNKSNEQKFWDDMYLENPDLKDQDRAVKSVLREKFDEFAKLPVSEARKKLAAEARQFVSSVRQGANVRSTELPAGGAPALGASGAPAPRVVTQEQSVSFIDQVKKARRRG